MLYKHCWLSWYVASEVSFSGSHGVPQYWYVALEVSFPAPMGCHFTALLKMNKKSCFLYLLETVLKLSLEGK